MKKILMKYNPYKIETLIEVDGEELKENSKVKELFSQGGRLQNWIEDFPAVLSDEYQEKVFHITFCGTTIDFQDVRFSFEDACSGELDLTIEDLAHVKGEECKDKEARLADVFRQIQNGPFPELNDPALQEAFEKAQGKDYEVCVVATMSAGKSTLINALLQNKLMPSKQEACTAIITKIKDTSGIDGFSAQAFDKNDKKLKEDLQLSLKTMNLWNDDENVTQIQVQGNIPFVQSEETSLVLTDTPGPNNAQNRDHGDVQEEFLKKDSKALILYVMTGEFGTDDDERTLSKVADAMKVNGKQSKDRFLFVVNKLDGRSDEDGAVEDTLSRVKKFLAKAGIEHPNVFPASALTALGIRRMQHGDLSDAIEVEEMKWKVRKQNQRATMHFEEHASIPKSLKAEINKKIELTKETFQGDEGTNPEEALFHTGIPSVELAISQYVEKYSKTDKIKTLCDTFSKLLESRHYAEELKTEIGKNEGKREEVQKTIEEIQAFLNEGKMIKSSKDEIQHLSQMSLDDVEKGLDKLESKFNNQLGKLSDTIISKGELEKAKAMREVGFMEKRVKQLQTEATSDVNTLVLESFKDSCEMILREYQKKLSEILKNTATKGFEIDLNKLMVDKLDISFDVNDIDDIDDLLKSKQVKVDSKWVPRKKTFVEKMKFWDWGEEYGSYEAIYATQEYITGVDLAEEFLSPLSSQLSDYFLDILKKSKTQNNLLIQFFEKQFDDLDKILNAELDKISKFNVDKDKIQDEILECEKKLEWIEEIYAKIDEILEV